MTNYSTFLVIDTAMLSDVETKLWAKRKRRPEWVVPLYDREAWDVSPIVIDIEAAHRANRIEVVLDWVNKRNPKLHVSIIDTSLSMSELVEHLRKFTYVLTADGTELTLRLADCVVLSWLQDLMMPDQWAAMCAPIKRWLVHSRNGKLSALRDCSGTNPSPLPLLISMQQMTNFEDASEPDQLLCNLRQMRPGHQWAESVEREFHLAESTLKFWREAQQTDATTLQTFARGVFDSRGALLEFPNLNRLLATRDMSLLQKDLQSIVTSLVRTL